MQDPERITRVVEELARTWRAQPDSTLAQVWGQIEARGVALNSTDGEVVEALRGVRRAFPVSFSFPDATPDQPSSVLIETAGPARKVTLCTTPDGQLWVIVRQLSGGAGVGAAPVQPGVWRASEVRTCTAGAPLNVVDTEGNAHRLGVVRRIEALDEAPENEPEVDLSGSALVDWEGSVTLAVLEDGSTVQFGRTITHWQQLRRELELVRYNWLRIISCRGGEPLVFVTADGGRQELGDVKVVLRAE